jgi:hypothetical protein
MSGWNMSRQATKTNNDPKWISRKIELRLLSLPQKQDIRVLDAFGGEGVLWKSVKDLSKLNIKILGIDKKEYSSKQLKGDNLKFLSSMDLSQFDIIDLDAYGSPFEQLNILYKRKYSGIVHCTYITQGLGGIPDIIFEKSNIPKKMHEKCHTIFRKLNHKMVFNYLHFIGITKVNGYFGIKSTGMEKNYFYFFMNKMN